MAFHLEVTKTDVNFLKLKFDVWLPNSQTGAIYSVDFDAGIECLNLYMHASHHSDGIYTGEIVLSDSENWVVGLLFYAVSATKAI